MNATTKDSIGHWLRPVRFVLLYSLAIATIFFALPSLAGYLENRYESISQPARFALVLVFAMAVAGAHLLTMRRNRED